VICGAAPDEAPPDIAIEIDRFVLPRGFRNVENQQPTVLSLDYFVRRRNLITNFLSGTEPAK
jgi:hypothetical protein